jgi:AraC family transcriptional regulator
MDPVTAHLRLDHFSTVPSEWRGLDQFSITRLESTCGLGSDVRKWSCVPALLVSVSASPLAGEKYRLWVDEKLVPTGDVRPFRSNVIDFASGPACWVGEAFDFVHFHLPRVSIDELADDLGYDRPGAFRFSVLGEDAVLARIARSVLRSVSVARVPSVLALDQLQLSLGEHMLERYGGMTPRRSVRHDGLAIWQSRRAEEILRERLDGAVRLEHVARECELPPGHFASAFRASFGTSCHRWLGERRIQRAKELLSRSRAPLNQVASHSGFEDHVQFARIFRRSVGVAPSTWRRGRGVSVH